MLNLPNITSGAFRRHFVYQSVSTPNFWQLVKEGARLPNHPHLKWVCERVDPYVSTYAGSMQQLSSQGETFPSSCWGAGYTYSQTDPSGVFGTRFDSRSYVLSLARNRVLEKVRKTPVDLGVALGEYRETANFVASAMVKTAAAAKAAKKGDISRMVQIITGRKAGRKGEVFQDVVGRKSAINGKRLKRIDAIDPRHRKMLDVIGRDTSKWSSVPLSAAGTLLCYNYAVSPLYKDVTGAMLALEEGLLDPAVVRYKSGGVKSTNHIKHSAVQNLGNGKWRGYDYDFEYYARVVIDVVIENDITATLDKLGLMNPISTGYELIPFSFVVDWFLPIGDYLRNVQAPYGLKVVYGWEKEFMKGTWSEWTDQSKRIPPRNWNTRLKGTEIYKKRTPLTSFPEFSFLVPDLGLSHRRIASGSALLTQLTLSDVPDAGGNKPTRKDWRILNKLGMSRHQFRRIAKQYR